MVDACGAIDVCSTVHAMPDLITSPEAAAMLGVSVRTVHRKIEEGRLTPAKKLPGPTGAYLFNRADVEALAQQRRDAEQRRRAS